MSREELVTKARDEYGITNADQMQDDQLKTEMKAIDEQADSVEDTTEDTGEQDLSSMTRAELNELAASEGVEDPESYSNKDELIKGIEDNRA